MAAPYYLQFQGSEFGPLNIDEVIGIVGGGGMKGVIFVWTEGMSNWLPAEGVPEIAEALGIEAIVIPERMTREVLYEDPTNLDVEGRRSARFPLVATIAEIQSNRPVQVIGLCSNVSSTGIRVILDDDVMISPADVVEMEIRPVSISGLRPFRFTARVVWVNREDPQAGLEFTRLAESDLADLRAFLKSWEKKR